MQPVVWWRVGYNEHRELRRADRRSSSRMEPHLDRVRRRQL